MLLRVYEVSWIRERIDDCFQALNRNKKEMIRGSRLTTSGNSNIAWQGRPAHFQNAKGEYVHR